MNINDMIKEANLILVEIHASMPDTTDIESALLGVQYVPASASLDWRNNPSISFQNPRGVNVQLECSAEWLESFVGALKLFCQNNNIEIEGE